MSDLASYNFAYRRGVKQRCQFDVSCVTMHSGDAMSRREPAFAINDR